MSDLQMKLSAELQKNSLIEAESRAMKKNELDLQLQLSIQDQKISAIEAELYEVKTDPYLEKIAMTITDTLKVTAAGVCNVFGSLYQFPAGFGIQNWKRFYKSEMLSLIISVILTVILLKL
jgi:hypothetical protein